MTMNSEKTSVESAAERRSATRSRAPVYRHSPANMPSDANTTRCVATFTTNHTQASGKYSPGMLNSKRSPKAEREFGVWRVIASFVRPRERGARAGGPEQPQPGNECFDPAVVPTIETGVEIDCNGFIFDAYADVVEGFSEESEANQHAVIREFRCRGCRRLAGVCIGRDPLRGRGRPTPKARSVAKQRGNGGRIQTLEPDVLKAVYLVLLE